MFQIYGQNYFDSVSLATPVKKRKATPIDLMLMGEELDLDLVNEKNREMMEYIRNALTSENVNTYAKSILEGKTAISVGHVFAEHPNDLVKIIGLFTYQNSPEREFDIKTKNITNEEEINKVYRDYELPDKYIKTSKGWSLNQYDWTSFAMIAASAEESAFSDPDSVTLPEITNEGKKNEIISTLK